jgi:hypothetical protein
MRSPTWLSASKALKLKQPLWFVAAFDLSFNSVVHHFSARPSTDREGGGAGPIRYLFLQLRHDRIAMITDERRAMRGVSLYLYASPDGEVDWEDYEQVMQSLGVPLEEVFRQGGLMWRRRSGNCTDTPGGDA